MYWKQGKTTRKIIWSGFQARSSVKFTELDVLAQETIEYICTNDMYIEVPEYEITPNDIHMTIILTSVGRGSPTLHTIVGRKKSYTKYKIPSILATLFS